MKNAKKKIKVIAKETVSNNNYEASMKTAIKAIDKAASKGVASKNFVARNKSRLSKKVNNMN